MHDLRRGAEVPDALAPYLAVDRSRPRHECWVTGHMVAGLDGTASVGVRVGSLSTLPDQELFRRMRQLADITYVITCAAADPERRAMAEDHTVFLRYERPRPEANRHE